MDERRSNKSVWRAAAVLSSSGVQLALMILVGSYAGKWLDGRLHTSPAWTIVGLLVGLGLGLGGLVLILWRFFNED